MPTQWVQAREHLFELRPGRRAILYVNGNRVPHDYSVAEIRCYCRWPEDGWQFITEDEAKKLLEAAIEPREG